MATGSADGQPVPLQRHRGRRQRGATSMFGSVRLASGALGGNAGTTSPSVENCTARLGEEVTAMTAERPHNDRHGQRLGDRLRRRQRHRR